MNNFNTPQETVEAIVKKWIVKVNLPILYTILLWILAGAYIWFWAQIWTVVATWTSDFLGYGMTKLLVWSVFSVWLMLVVIAWAELFTGNNLIIKAVLKNKVTWWQLWKNLWIVYFSNFIWALLLVFLIYYSDLWQSSDSQVWVTAIKIANAKVNLEFFPALIRWLLCNWLVCLAIVLAVASRDIISKIFAIFFPIMIFVASGYEHSIANMYYIPMWILLKWQEAVVNSAWLDLINLTWWNFIFSNLVPVTIWNIIWWMLFVWIFYTVVYLKKK